VVTARFMDALARPVVLSASGVVCANCDQRGESLLCFPFSFFSSNLLISLFRSSDQNTQSKTSGRTIERVRRRMEKASSGLFRRMRSVLFFFLSFSFLPGRAGSPGYLCPFLQISVPVPFVNASSFASIILRTHRSIAIELNHIPIGNLEIIDRQRSILILGKDSESF